MPQLKVQNFYSTTITSDIVTTGTTTFTVAVAPTYTAGYLVLSPNNTALREIVYFHDVTGNTVSIRVENRGLGGTTAKLHTTAEPIAMKDIAEIFNMFSDSISQCFFVEKTGGLTIKVWGGTVFYNGNPVIVADTNLTLADNQTNYIKYSYPTNTISVDTVNSGNIKARVITAAGAITSIQYYVAKESYIDFTVAITGALPSQVGQAGKGLVTDGTNVSWQTLAVNTPIASETVDGKVEIATLAQSTAGTNTGETGAPLVCKPADIKVLYQPVGNYTFVQNGAGSSLSASAGPSAVQDNSSSSTGLITTQTVARLVINHGGSFSTGYLMGSTDNVSFSPVYTYSTNIDITFVLQPAKYYKVRAVTTATGGAVSCSSTITYTT